VQSFGTNGIQTQTIFSLNPGILIGFNDTGLLHFGQRVSKAMWWIDVINTASGNKKMADMFKLAVSRLKLNIGQITQYNVRSMYLVLPTSLVGRGPLIAGFQPSCGSHVNPVYTFVEGVTMLSYVGCASSF